MVKIKTKPYFFEEPLQITKVSIDTPIRIERSIARESRDGIWKEYYRIEYRFRIAEDDQKERSILREKLRKLRLIIKDINTILRKSYMSVD